MWFYSSRRYDFNEMPILKISFALIRLSKTRTTMNKSDIRRWVCVLFVSEPCKMDEEFVIILVSQQFEQTEDYMELVKLGWIVKAQTNGRLGIFDSCWCCRNNGNADEPDKSDKFAWQVPHTEKSNKIGRGRIGVFDGHHEKAFGSQTLKCQKKDTRRFWTPTDHRVGTKNVQTRYNLPSFVVSAQRVANESWLKYCFLL